MKIFSSILICLMLMGCTAYQKNLKEMAVTNLENAAAFREFSDSWASTWMLNSCLLRAAIGPVTWQQLPREVTDAWDANDLLAQKETLSECDKSTIVGNTILISSETTKLIIEKYAPQAISYFRALVL